MSPPTAGKAPGSELQKSDLLKQFDWCLIKLPQFQIRSVPWPTGALEKAQYHGLEVLLKCQKIELLHLSYNSFLSRNCAEY